MMYPPTLIPIPAIAAFTSFTTIIATTTTPHPKSESMPDNNEEDCTNQCRDNMHPVDIRVVLDSEWNDIGEDPNANQRGDDCPNNTQWKSPPNDKLCDDPDNRSYHQIGNLLGSDRDRLGTNNVCKHKKLLSNNSITFSSRIHLF